MTRPEDRRSDRDLDELEAGIERTRSAISEGIDTLGQKLSKENLKQGAREALTDARHKARDAASERLRSAGNRAREAGGAGLEYARDNAVPLALIGIGFGLLVQRSRSRSVEFETETEESPWLMGGPEEPGFRGEEPSFGERARETAGEVRGRAEELSGRVRGKAEEVSGRVRGKAEEVKERATEVEHRAEERVGAARQRAREGIQRAGTRARDISQENPLATAAAALVAGLGIGLLLPSTRRENELMGNIRDRLADEARETFGGVRRAVTDTAREARSAVAETAHH